MINRTALRAASRAAASLFALTWAIPAMAQTGEANSDTIIVTGTLIAGSAEDAAAPVTIITADDLLRAGSPSPVDLARRLPVSAGVIGDSSQFDTRSQFAQGVSSVNLRGLGPQRTLVLLNGKRLAATGGGNVPLVDLNLIPLHAVAKIEILKDGGAATHGSDAMGGVVNLLTRTDQDGLLVSGDYRYVDGSSGDWTGAASFGREFGDVRVFAAGGYQRRGELRMTDRAFAWRPFAENPQGGFTGGGNPGNFDFNGTVGGLVFEADEGCAGLGGFRSLPGSSADLCQASYLGFTNLVEPEERYQLFGDVHVYLSQDADLRLTGLYGRTQTWLHTSPSFLPTIAPSANAAFGGTGLFTIPAYAPALADYCARFGAAAGCALDGAGNPIEPALAFPIRFRPMLAGGNPLFASAKNDRAATRLDYNNDSYQLAATFRADLGDSYYFYAAGTWSRYNAFYQVGDSFVDLLQNALAGFGGENCAYASPQSRAGLSAAQLAALAGTAGCTWFNPFSTGIAANAVTGVANPNFAANGNPLGLSLQPGAGLVNDSATIGHFYNVWDRVADTRQMVLDMVVGGNPGLTLPGGEVQVALGLQLRRDRFARRFEGGTNLDLFPCPGSVLNPAATCNPETGALGFIGAGRDFSVSRDVAAVFGEVQVPLANTLSAQISARYEDYEGDGSTFDPQVRLRFQPAEWLVLRGGVGSTFRAPPPNQTLADSVILTFIGGGFRAVDILANPNLRPEKATTWNAGAVVESGGFHASLDYWRYDISGAIENEPIGGMVAALFGTSGTANCGNPAFAALQARFTFAGGVCGAANVQRLATYAFNSTSVTTSGLDGEVSQEWELAGGDVQLGVAGSYILAYKVGEVAVAGVPVQPAFNAVGLLNFQTTAYPLPRTKGQAWLQWRGRDHSLRAQVNHVAGYEDQRGAAIFGPNTAALAGASVTAGKRLKAFTTLDLVWLWDLDEVTRLSLVLDNVLDADPPLARLDQNYDPFTASPLGATVKLGISRSF
ncbi:TonB-dependent receptor domain-containing protein [Altererythrobacter lauratis]|uniref:TonB-dependent receptor domain-containing protein n=1 Tax=Alteraurantiacibacter lauratis TaxID=2054627 RepID=A0ABV7EK11_9SPHN